MTRDDFASHTERDADLFERDRVHDDAGDVPDLRDVLDLDTPQRLPGGV